MPLRERTCCIITFGCQMNVYDSTRMESMLSQMGYECVDNPQNASLVIVNTCSVREKAQHKLFSLLGRLRKLKRNGTVLGVAGCVAQQEGMRLLERMEHVDFLLGTAQIERLPEALEEVGRGRRVAFTSLKPMPVTRPSVPCPRVGVRAMLTVMTGCNNFCSYCVVPYVRGRERSRPAPEILAEASALVEAGAKEIMLLGQNVDSYRDPSSGLEFAGLLREVARLPGLVRVSFTTNHPRDFTEAIAQVIATEPTVVRYVHMPAQAGSDRVLAVMRRGYTRAQYLEKVRMLREIAGDVALGGDMIVGFPGETQEDFTQSLSLLEEVRYDLLYSFAYSDRPFTRASRMSGKLPTDVKLRRLGQLQALQREISRQLHQALVGTRARVLVEGPAKKGQGLMAGHDECGRVVNFPGEEGLVGQVVEVEITEGRENSLVGRIVDPAREG